MHARSEDLSNGNVRPCVLSQSNWRYPLEVTDLRAMEKYLEKSVSPFRQSSSSKSLLWAVSLTIPGMPPSLLETPSN